MSGRRIGVGLGSRSPARSPLWVLPPCDAAGPGGGGNAPGDDLLLQSEIQVRSLTSGTCYWLKAETPLYDSQSYAYVSRPQPPRLHTTLQEARVKLQASEKRRALVGAVQLHPAHT